MPIITYYYYNDHYDSGLLLLILLLMNYSIIETIKILFVVQIIKFEKKMFLFLMGGYWH